LKATPSPAMITLIAKASAHCGLRTPYVSHLWATKELAEELALQHFAASITEGV